MKHIGYSVSIKNGSNKVIAHSDADMSSVREGSFIRFSDDSVFYTVSRPENMHFIKDFEVVAQRQIKISGDIDGALLPGDTVYITYKEYELSTIISAANAGSGYKVGDILILDGGVLSVSSQDNMAYPAKIKVSSVDGTGGISQFSIIQSGKYLISPVLFCSTTGGSGYGAQFNTIFSVLDNRANLERTIESVNNLGTHSIVTFTYYLPSGVTIGKISCDKWTLLLTSSYSGASKENVDYHLLRDLTPHFGLPLIPKNSPNFELIFNQAITKIDEILNNAVNKINNKPGY